MAGVDGLGEPGPAQDLGSGRSYFEATIDADISSPEAFAIVEATRDAVHAVSTAPTRWSGGGSAFYLDTKVASTRDNKVIIPIVLVVVFLILMLCCGRCRAADPDRPPWCCPSAPRSASRRCCSSTSSASPVPIPAFPLFAFVFLVALGIDYNIFLMTRVREETATRGTRQGSLVALTSTGGVITSAGLVLAATFLVLGTHPGGVPGRARGRRGAGVLLDTLIVRSVLVTAINLDLGGKIWWPSKLDRGDTTSGPAGTGARGAIAR